MSVHAVAMIAFTVFAIWVLPGLLSYAIFRPFADTLKQKALLSLVAFPVLFAMVGPMLYEQGPDMVPVYFVRWGSYFMATTVVLHYAERLFGTGS
jgi:hypothetical protein